MCFYYCASSFYTEFEFFLHVQRRRAQIDAVRTKDSAEVDAVRTKDSAEVDAACTRDSADSQLKLRNSISIVSVSL